MRRSFFGTVALGLGLALGATGLASAQTDSDRNGSGPVVNNPSARTVPADNRDDRGMNPGYAGLLGLVGLAGLIPLFTRRDHNVRRDNYARTTAAGRTQG
jgi:hypothetical protein